MLCISHICIINNFTFALASGLNLILEIKNVWFILIIFLLRTWKPLPTMYKFWYFFIGNAKELYPVSFYFTMPNFFRRLILFSVTSIFFSFITDEQTKNDVSSHSFTSTSTFSYYPILLHKLNHHAVLLSNHKP